MGKTFFITIDAHSKWIEAQTVEAARAQTTVECLRSMFATHGLPEQVVSDNGSVFTSQDFKDFMDLNGIDHIRVSPYHPSSNGLAERAVQIVKSGLAKTKGSTLACRLAKVLFAYSITLPPQSTTGVPPSTLLMGRSLSSRLDRLRPNTGRRVQQKQVLQKQSHDGSRPWVREFQVEQKVYCQNFGRGANWLAGTVTAKTGPLSYRIGLPDGRE